MSPHPIYPPYHQSNHTRDNANTQSVNRPSSSGSPSKEANKGNAGMVTIGGDAAIMMTQERPAATCVPVTRRNTSGGGSNTSNYQRAGLPSSSSLSSHRQGIFIGTPGSTNSLQRHTITTNYSPHYSSVLGGGAPVALTGGVSTSNSTSKPAPASNQKQNNQRHNDDFKLSALMKNQIKQAKSTSNSAAAASGAGSSACFDGKIDLAVDNMLMIANNNEQSYRRQFPRTDNTSSSNTYDLTTSPISGQNSPNTTTSSSTSMIRNSNQHASLLAPPPSHGSVHASTSPSPSSHHRNTNNLVDFTKRNNPILFPPQPTSLQQSKIKNNALMTRLSSQPGSLQQLPPSLSTLPNTTTNSSSRSSTNTPTGTTATTTQPQSRLLSSAAAAAAAVSNHASRMLHHHQHSHHPNSTSTLNNTATTHMVATAAAAARAQQHSSAFLLNNFPFGGVGMNNPSLSYQSSASANGSTSTNIDSVVLGGGGVVSNMGSSIASTTQHFNHAIFGNNTYSPSFPDIRNLHRTQQKQQQHQQQQQQNNRQKKRQKQKRRKRGSMTARINSMSPSIKSVVSFTQEEKQDRVVNIDQIIESGNIKCHDYNDGDSKKDEKKNMNKKEITEEIHEKSKINHMGTTNNATEDKVVQVDPKVPTDTGTSSSLERPTKLVQIQNEEKQQEQVGPTTLMKSTITTATGIKENAIEASTNEVIANQDVQIGSLHDNQSKSTIRKSASINSSGDKVTIINIMNNEKHGQPRQKKRRSSASLVDGSVDSQIYPHNQGRQYPSSATGYNPYPYNPQNYATAGEFVKNANSEYNLLLQQQQQKQQQQKNLNSFCASPKHHIHRQQQSLTSANGNPHHQTSQQLHPQQMHHPTNTKISSQAASLTSSSSYHSMQAELSRSNDAMKSYSSKDDLGADKDKSEEVSTARMLPKNEWKSTKSKDHQSFDGRVNNSSIIHGHRHGVVSNFVSGHSPTSRKNHSSNASSRLDQGESECKKVSLEEKGIDSDKSNASHLSDKNGERINQQSKMKGPSIFANTITIERSIMSLRTWPKEAQWTYYALLFHLVQQQQQPSTTSTPHVETTDSTISTSNASGKEIMNFTSPQQVLTYILQKLIMENFCDSSDPAADAQSRLILACMIEVNLKKKGKKHILGLAIVGTSAQSVRHCVSMIVDFDFIARVDPNAVNSSQSQHVEMRSQIVCDVLFKKHLEKIDNPVLKKCIVMSNIEFCDVETWAETLARMHNLEPKSTRTTKGPKKKTLDDWKHVLVRLPMPSTDNISDNTPTHCVQQKFGFLPLQIFQNGNRIHHVQQPAAIDMGVWQRKQEVLKVRKSRKSKGAVQSGEGKLSEPSPVIKNREGRDPEKIQMNQKNVTSEENTKDIANDLTTVNEQITTIPPKSSFAKASFDFLRSYIEWTANGKGNVKERDNSYPHAPLGEVWVDGNLKTFIDKLKMEKEGEINDYLYEIEKITLASKNPVHLNEGKSLLGRRWVWDEGQYTDCGKNNNAKRGSIESTSTRGSLDGPRRSERYGSSVRLSNVLSEIADGRLDPHTLISCDGYASGPIFRLLQMSKELKKESTSHNHKDTLDTLMKDVLEISSDERIDPNQAQPFAIKVCPDVSFVADMHAHLSESEVIGLLGGRYVPSERCLYVQAAFPCKSTSRVDGGLTDVEMDPVSQITAGDAISDHGMSVVGWYHSHPRFQPDPSITDIENQNNYQELFRSEILKSENRGLCPFVGLIIGTYDGRNPSARSVMRWFHVTKKSGTSSKSEGINFPMKLEVTHRKRRVFQYDDTMESKTEAQKELTSSGSAIRFIDELTQLKKTLQRSMQLGTTKNNLSNLLLLQDSMQPLPNQSKAENTKKGENHNPDSFVHAKEIFASSRQTNHTNDDVKEYSTSQAHSLPYTREELKILSMDEFNGVTDEIRAGILWHAIEREQLQQRNEKTKPPSASAILQLLLSPTVNIAEGGNTNYTEILDDDAIIVHAIDVVLSHYAKDIRKINPFESWSGAWNLSIGLGKSIPKSAGQEGAKNDDSLWWKAYYRAHVLGSQKNNMKMVKGHKITTCLLHWAKHMHLNERKRWGSTLNERAVSISGSSNPAQIPRDVEFVSEIMRLLVARWYEASTKSSSGFIGLKKRGVRRKTNVNHNDNQTTKSSAKSASKRQKRGTKN